MSDDPNRPDADHELEVNISAFLPEGSRFATADDEVDEPAPVDDAEVAEDGVESDLENETSGGPGDGGASDAGASSGDADVDDDVDDGWDTGAPAPEIPEWARDDLPPPPVADGPDQPVDDASEPAPVTDVGPAVPAAPEVDTTVLTRIEGELADVDAAIAAIDAGDLALSPLLSELLAADRTESASPDTDHG